MSRFIGRGGDVVPIILEPINLQSILYENNIASQLSSLLRRTYRNWWCYRDYNDGGTLYRTHIFTSSGEFTDTVVLEPLLSFYLLQVVVQVATISMEHRR